MTNNFKLETFLDLELNLLHFGGCYAGKNPDKVFYCRKIFTYIISFGQLLSMFVKIFEVSDLLKLADITYILVTQATFCCKLFCFNYNTEKFQRVLNYLAYENFNNQSIYHQQVFTKAFWMFKTVSTVFRFLCANVVLFFIVFPIIDPTSNLPINSWYPFDENEYRIFVYIFQIISILLSAYNNSSIDLLTVGLLTVASEQFNTLGKNLQSIKYFNNDGKCERKEIKLIRKLNTFIVHHITIFSFLEETENIFSIGIFIQFVASIIVICLTGFQMLMVSPKSVQFVLLVIYFFCMLNQVALYCWYGHEVLINSYKVSQGCYESEWYTSSPRIQKILIIIMTRASRPTVLTAEHFFTLTLITLSLILRSSYSYFALLQTMYTKGNK